MQSLGPTIPHCRTYRGTEKKVIEYYWIEKGIKLRVDDNNCHLMLYKMHLPVIIAKGPAFMVALEIERIMYGFTKNIEGSGNFSLKSSEHRFATRLFPHYHIFS